MTIYFLSETIICIVLVNIRNIFVNKILLWTYQLKPAEYLKWNNPPSIFGIVHYYFRNSKTRRSFPAG